MLEITDFWVWDSWYVRHDGVYHAFYLQAPTALRDPALRHSNAGIGHSSSPDLVNWTPLPNVLEAGAGGDFDDLAVWTGSIVHRDGLWHLFYTGVEARSHTKIQRVGHAVSTDLVAWTRRGLATQADARWYSTAADAPSYDEPWRDPWVFRLDGLWHMLVTAREPTGSIGSVGHCTSNDLATWQVQPALSTNAGFSQIEVIQVLEVSGHHVIVFCAASGDVHSAGTDAVTGTYSAPADGPLGPFHFDRAEAIRAAGIYAGRVLEGPTGELVLLGFIEADAGGRFVGAICDPVPLLLTPQGTLQPVPAPH